MHSWQQHLQVCEWVVGRGRGRRRGSSYRSYDDLELPGAPPGHHRGRGAAEDTYIIYYLLKKQKKTKKVYFKRDVNILTHDPNCVDALLMINYYQISDSSLFKQGCTRVHVYSGQSPYNKLHFKALFDAVFEWSARFPNAIIT